jgi:hypothetical protein
MRKVTDQEAHTVLTFPSNSTLQPAVSVPMSVKCLVYIQHEFFSFYPEANVVNGTHSLVPATVKSKAKMMIMVRNMI